MATAAPLPAAGGASASHNNPPLGDNKWQSRIWAVFCSAISSLMSFAILPWGLAVGASIFFSALFLGLAWCPGSGDDDAPPNPPGPPPAYQPPASQQAEVVHVNYQPAQPPVVVIQEEAQPPAAPPRTFFQMILGIQPPEPPRAPVGEAPQHARFTVGDAAALQGAGLRPGDLQLGSGVGSPPPIPSAPPMDTPRPQDTSHGLPPLAPRRAPVRTVESAARSEAAGLPFGAFHIRLTPPAAQPPSAPRPDPLRSNGGLLLPEEKSAGAAHPSHRHPTTRPPQGPSRGPRAEVGAGGARHPRSRQSDG